MNKLKKKQYDKNRYKLNKQKKNKQSQLYYQKNKKKVINRTKKYYIKNKNKRLNQQKKYNKINKLKIKKYHQIYGKMNRKKLSENSQNYYKSHKKQIDIYRKKWIKNKLKIDINFKLREYIRNRLYQTIKGKYKSKSILKLVGCSIKQLKQYLEKQFTKGMSWSNYGKWHIDHIKSCCSFDLSKPSEQRKCFHYTNLQPLWAKDNWSKKRK